MRPNGRTIYKYLMKNRYKSLGRHRASVVVRIPVEVVAEPPPMRNYLKEFGKQQTSSSEEPDGLWLNENDDTESMTRIFKASKNGVYNFYHTHDGEVYVAEKCCWKKEKNDIPNQLDTLSEPVSEEMFKSYIDFHKWEYKNLNYFSNDMTPVLRAFFNVSDWSCYFGAELSDDGKHIFITYSVKYFRRPFSIRGFCSSLKKAFRLADASGYNVKLYR